MPKKNKKKSLEEKYKEWKSKKGHLKPEGKVGNRIIYDIESSQQRQKYDLHKMKVEFLKGPWRSVGEYLKEKYGEEFYKRNRRNFYHFYTKGWAKEKHHLQERAMELATQKYLDEMIDDEKEVRARQHRIGKLLQSKGIKSLKYAFPKTFNEITKLIEIGVNIERKALGLDKKKEKPVPSRLTQVNIEKLNIAKTRFDELLEKLDYRGILRLIAEVRKEKSRRNRELPSIAGSEKAK